MSYKYAFQDRESASSYSSIYEGVGSYVVCLWEVEKRILQALLEKRMATSTARHLDFAAGTGRVLEFLEARTLQSCGVDVSQTMLDVAEQNTQASRLIQADITQAEGQEFVTGPYEIITAFRFFLNAEPELREQALCALARRLTDDGVLILNNHGNVRSVKAFGRLYHLLKRTLGWADSVPAYLSDREIGRLAELAGLRVTEAVGYGLLGGRVGNIVGGKTMSEVEGWFAGRSWIQRFGTCRMYCLEKL